MKKTPFFLILIGLLIFMFSCENEKLETIEQEQTATNTVLDLSKAYSAKHLKEVLATETFKIPINDNLTITAQNLKKVENISIEGENPFFKNMISYVSDNMVISYNEEELFLNYTDNNLDYLLSYSIKTQRASNNKGLKASDNLVNIIEQEHFTFATIDYKDTVKKACVAHENEMLKTNNNSSSLRRVDDKDWKIYLYYDKEHIEDYSKFKVNVKSSINFFKKIYAYVDDANIKFKFKKKSKILPGLSEDVLAKFLNFLKKKEKKKSHRIYVFMHNKTLLYAPSPEEITAQDGLAHVGKKDGYRLAWANISSKKTLAHEVGHTLGALHNDKKYRSKKSKKRYYAVMHSYKEKRVKGFRGKNRKIVKNALQNED